MRKLFIGILTISLLFTGAMVADAQWGGGGAWGSVVNYLRMVATSILPSADDTYDVGSPEKQWQDGYFDGTLYADAIDAEIIPLADLSDVTITSVATDEMLAYSGSGWVNQTANETNLYTQEEILELIAGGNFDFLLNDTASGVGAYYEMDSTPTGEAEATFSEAIIADATLIDSFITPAGQPTFTTISAGIYSLHFHATTTTAVNIETVRVYYEFYKRAAGGAETLIATSEESDVLTATKTNYNIHCIHGEITILTTDLLVIKVYGNIEDDTGPRVNNSTITIYVEGVNATRFSVNTTIDAFDARYLQLDGTGTMTGTFNSNGVFTSSTNTVDFGAENLTTSGTLGAGATTVTSLTDGTVTLSGGSFDTLDIAGELTCVGTFYVGTSGGIRDNGGGDLEFSEDGGTTWTDFGSGGGGGATYREYTFLPHTAGFDATNPAVVDWITSSGAGTVRFPRAKFDDGDDDVQHYSFTMPSDATASAAWILDIYSYSDEDADENVLWAIQISATSDNDADNVEEQAVDTADYQAENYDKAEAKALCKVSMTIDYANCDGAVAGDEVNFIFYRDGDGTGGTDDHTNEVYLTRLHLKIPRS